jgi:hypothetical protein
MSYHDNLIYRASMREWLEQQPFDFFVTLTTNREMSTETAEKHLRILDAAWNRKLFGKKFFRLPEDRRLFYVALPEHKSNLHYHLLVRVPVAVRNSFRAIIPALWKRQVPSGTVDVREIDNLRTAAGYAVKSLWNDFSRDHYVLSSQFHKSHESIPYREEIVWKP